MKRSKGFTLIELLTVIAILAIILLIAAPTILGVLDKARKNTFKNQVLLYVEGLKQQVALSAIGEGNITLPDVGGEPTIVDISNIPMDTNTGLSGKIRIENEDGNYKYILVDVQNSDYKVIGKVEARSLDLSNIEKNDGTSTPAPTYTAYTIGQQVTLKDNSTWYVIENSGTSSSTVTLFASQNMKNSESGWTTAQSEYAMAFDEANARTTEKNSYCTNPSMGCNIYAAQSGTLTEDSSIKKFLGGSVKTYINNSLTSSGGTAIDSNSIRLIKTDEICNIINAANSSNNCTLSTAYYWNNGTKALQNAFSNVPSWLYSTNYWTMIPYASDSYNVYIVDTNGHLYVSGASNDGGFGTRPVIETNKSNIK